MKTIKLFAPLMVFCATAALVGCASAGRRVSTSLPSAQNPPLAEVLASPALPQHAVLDENAFRKLDLNGDGTITLNEWQQFDKSAAAKDNFGALDENGDGQINVTEFLTQAPKHSQRYHFLGDTDKTTDSYFSTDKEAFEQPGWQLFSFHF